MSAESSMRTVTVWIGKQDHLVAQSAFNTYSTHKQNALLAGEIFMLGLKQYLTERSPGERDRLDSQAMLRVLDWETRQRAVNQATLNGIVARGGLSETEIDLLHGIALDLDLDESEAAAIAERSPFASAVAQGYNGTQSGRCMRWLASLIDEQPEGIARPDLVERAEVEGYTESMLNRVSRRLGIEKRKGQGGTWFWFPPIVLDVDSADDAHPF